MMPNNKEIAEKIVLAGLGPKDAANCGGCDMADAIEAALDAKDAQLDIATAALRELWNRFDSGCESAYHDPEASFRNRPDYPGGCPVCAGTNQGKIARVAQAALAKIGADDE